MQSKELAWDDVRLFLALARGRKLGSAAKVLDLDASTLSRRLFALEKRCGVRLFERTRDGLVPTAAGERLLAPAQETEDSVMRFFEQVHPDETTVEGTVRITAPPGIIEFLVMPSARAFIRQHPKLRFEIDASEAVASLTRREADVAIRLARPAGEGLVVRRVGTSPNAIFAASELVESLGQLESFDDAPWIAWDTAHGQLLTARWFASNVNVEPLVRASTMLAQVASAECCLGITLLPSVIAEKRRLVRVKLARNLVASAPIPSDDVYLMCHAALREVPRIKVSGRSCSRC